MLLFVTLLKATGRRMGGIAVKAIPLFLRSSHRSHSELIIQIGVACEEQQGFEFVAS